MIHALSALNGPYPKFQRLTSADKALSAALFFCSSHTVPLPFLLHTAVRQTLPGSAVFPPFSTHLLGLSFPFFPTEPCLARGPYSQIGLHWGDKCTANALKRVVKKKKKNADSACQDYHPSWRGWGGRMGRGGRFGGEKRLWSTNLGSSSEACRYSPSHPLLRRKRDGFSICMPVCNSWNYITCRQQSQTPVVLWKYCFVWVSSVACGLGDCREKNTF